MKRNNKTRIFSICLSAIIFLVLSCTLIFDLLIPDICYYHFNEMDPILNVFFNVKGGDNGHPSPSLFNLIVSMLIGGLLGNQLYKFFLQNREFR